MFNDPDQMRGAIVRLRSWRHYPDNGQIQWMEQAHPDRKMVGVFLLLGFERKDGSGPRIDPEAVVKQLGKEIG